MNGFASFEKKKHTHTHIRTFVIKLDHANKLFYSISVQMLAIPTWYKMIVGKQNKTEK